MTHDPFAQVRQAHRICGAYYQQILPMINEVAQKMGTSFLLWDTWSFSKPLVAELIRWRVGHGTTCR
jgi:hypothetical protein